jgi:hypothetical protein
MINRKKATTSVIQMSILLLGMISFVFILGGEVGFVRGETTYEYNDPANGNLIRVDSLSEIPSGYSYREIITDEKNDKTTYYRYPQAEGQQSGDITATGAKPVALTTRTEELPWWERLTSGGDGVTVPGYAIEKGAFTINGKPLPAGNYFKDGNDLVSASNGQIYRLDDRQMERLGELAQIELSADKKDYPYLFGLEGLGDQGFFWGHLTEGVQWAAISFGAIQIFGGIANTLTGGEIDINALSAAAAVGIIAGKAAYALFESPSFFDSTPGQSTGGLLGSGAVSTVIGAGVAWYLYTELYTNEEEFTQTVSFECLPWQAPQGSADCEKCNDDDLPCSEYRCESLGQSCELINQGTDQERCVDNSRADTNPPIITPNETMLTPGYKYSSTRPSPDSSGTEITMTNGDCIKPWTPIEFGFTTDEPM